MAQPSSFYDYAYSWQGTQYDALLTSLLNSCHSIMTHPSNTALCELINDVIHQQSLDGYYRLEVCNELFIEHFQQGRHVCYQGKPPQKGSQTGSVKVVEFEHAIIFKMRFIHLYLTKDHANTDLLEDTRDLWLLWLMHIESLCLQNSIEHCFAHPFTESQQKYAHKLNFHVDLQVNMSRLERHMKEIYYDFGEQVMSLINLSENIESSKYQCLITNALSNHQEKLCHLIKQQLGLFLSSDRLLKALLQS